MFQGPDNWAELTWQQKRDIRLEGWARRVGIKFDSPEAEKNYKARTARLAKAVRMEIPDRVPCMVPTGWFPAINARITLKEAMHDPEKMKWAWLKFVDEYD